MPALIGRMVRGSRACRADRGRRLRLSRFWGIARLPTAFIPNEDQGYLMIAAQLPDGASLGRTTAALDDARKAALATPGRRPNRSRSPGCRRSTISPISPTPASLCYAQAVGRARQERMDRHPVDCRAPPSKLNAAPDGRLFVLAPPPIQGIGNAGGFQMQTVLLGGSFDFQKLSERDRARSSRRPMPSPALQHVLTTFRPGAPQVTLTVDRDRAETLRVSVGDVFDALTVLSRLDLCQPVQQIRPVVAGLRPGGFEIPAAAGRSAEPLRPQPGQPDGADRRGRPSRLRRWRRR